MFIHEREWNRITSSDDWKLEEGLRKVVATTVHDGPNLTIFVIAPTLNFKTSTKT